MNVNEMENAMSLPAPVETRAPLNVESKSVGRAISRGFERLFSLLSDNERKTNPPLGRKEKQLRKTLAKVRESYGLAAIEYVILMK